VASTLQAHAALRHWEPAVTVEDVDGTTGAGDVATGGFLAGLMTGQGPVAAAGLAAREAARHVSGAPAPNDPIHHPSDDQETPS
jgi:sugar/nucleoside kinase (ribokinase family)